MRGILITVLLLTSTLCLALSLGSTTPGIRLWIGLPLAVLHVVGGVVVACRIAKSIMNDMEAAYHEARHY